MSRAGLFRATMSAARRRQEAKRKAAADIRTARDSGYLRGVEAGIARGTADALRPFRDVRLPDPLLNGSVIQERHGRIYCAVVAVPGEREALLMVAQRAVRIQFRRIENTYRDPTTGATIRWTGWEPERTEPW